MRKAVLLVICFLALSGCGAPHAEQETEDLFSTFSLDYDVDGRLVHVNFAPSEILQTTGFIRPGFALAVGSPPDETTFAFSNCLRLENTRTATQHQFTVSYGPFPPPLVHISSNLTRQASFVNIAPQVWLRMYLDQDGLTRAEYTAEESTLAPSIDAWILSYDGERLPKTMVHLYEGRSETWSVKAGTLTSSGNLLKAEPCPADPLQRSELTELGPTSDPPLEDSYLEARQAILDDPTLLNLRAFRAQHADLRVLSWTFDVGSDDLGQLQDQWRFLFSAKDQQDAIQVRCSWYALGLAVKTGSCIDSQMTRTVSPGDPLPTNWTKPEHWIELHQMLMPGPLTHIQVDYSGLAVFVELGRYQTTGTSISLIGLSYEAVQGRLLEVYWPT